LKEDKERQTRDLGAFFEEVGALDELGDAVEEDEEAQRERTDRAVQMSYMVRLARLYQQADRGATTTTSSSALTVPESEELILGVGDYSSSSLNEESVQQVKDNSKRSTIKTKVEVADTDTTGIENDVFSVMKKQRLERKRLREMARIDNDDDNDNAESSSAAAVTSVYDWTTKSV